MIPPDWAGLPMAALFSSSWCRCRHAFEAADAKLRQDKLTLARRRASMSSQIEVAEPWRRSRSG